MKKHQLKIIVSQDLEPENILKVFLNFTNFEPHYSYKIYSYKKRRVYISLYFVMKKLFAFYNQLPSICGRDDFKLSFK